MLNQKALDYIFDVNTKIDAKLSRLNQKIDARVTEAEAAELRERAQAARLSMGAYLRRRALGQRVRMAAELRLGAAELRELNRIGVNLNQMAYASPAYGSQS